MSVRLTVVHSYSKKMLESGDNQIKKKSRGGMLKQQQVVGNAACWYWDGQVDGLWKGGEGARHGLGWCDGVGSGVWLENG